MKYSLKYNSYVKHITIIAVVVAAVFAYTFNPKLDLGGDNCNYYMYATSLASGEGYRDPGTPGHPAVNSFPPGYPLLMAPLRAVTPDIIPQKILNGAFLLAATIVLYLFLRRTLPNPALALTAALAAALNYRVLQFASIMMSETSFLLFSALTLYMLYLFDKRDDQIKWWRNPWFYLMILFAGYAYMIRTQGVTLAVAVIVWLLTTRKWWQSAGFLCGFLLTTLPWAIRNHMAGLGGSRYLGQILAVNTWRPEEGLISFPELVERGFTTLKMLVTKAIPNTAIPYFRVDYNAPATFGEWVCALVLLGLIAAGFWYMRRYFWFFIAYLIVTLGIICLWSAPSENRYIVTLVPMLDIAIIVSVYYLLHTFASRILSVKNIFHPLLFLIPVVLAGGGELKRLHAEAREKTTPNYVNFYAIASYAREHLPKESVVCSRKPTLFFMYSQGYVCNYTYTLDDAQLIGDLIKSKVDYVVLEQLEYSSTARYLYPAIAKNFELFPVVFALKNPDTYLLKFERDAAVAKFGKP